MKKILVCNQKGGVGKSLIADELAFSFERSGIPTAFLDLDGQGGTIHKTDKNADAEVCVIDTPGALQPQLKDWLADADVIVVPTKTTSRDIEPLWRMKKAIEAAGKAGNAIYVMNGWNRYRASSDFFDWFLAASDGVDAPVIRIPQSEQFVQASAAKKSVIGFGKKSAAATVAMQELCDAVRAVAGFQPEG